MKIRIGLGLGTRTAAGDQSTFADLVDAAEDLGYDSLWLSERLGSPAPDPMLALAVAAGRTRRLKLGTSVLVVPGRNPVVLAKAMASLDRLSAGRFLPAVGLGTRNEAEQAAFGVARGDRGPWLDEALPLMRRLWTGEAVDHRGERFTTDGVRVGPAPLQDPLEVWLGGASATELARTGRLGDGWLASFTTPADVAEGWPVVNAAATEAGRTIDGEHLGAVVAYAPDGDAVPEAVADVVARRRPDLDPAEVIPVGHQAVRSTLKSFITAGASKFVVLPIDDPGDWPAEVAALWEAVGSLQT